MKTVNVAELKSHLSHFLQLVQKGAEVVITSHRHPVGKLVPHVRHEALHILPPRLPLKSLRRLDGVKPLKPVDVVRLLREDRDKR